MAETAKADEPQEKTKYRVLRKIDQGTEEGDAELAALGPDAELFVLVPQEYEGNVLKQAHKDHGDGEYAKFPARGFEVKNVAATTVVKVG